MLFYPEHALLQMILKYVKLEKFFSRIFDLGNMAGFRKV